MSAPRILNLLNFLAILNVLPATDPKRTLRALRIRTNRNSGQPFYFLTLTTRYLPLATAFLYPGRAFTVAKWQTAENNARDEFLSGTKTHYLNHRPAGAG